ncbi:MAG: hypothetical protein ACREQ3_16675, partial [Candidatus Binatia bacterium]
AEQKAVVEQVLVEIGAGDKPILTAFNKLDQLTDTAGNDQPWQRPSRQENAEGEDTFGISAFTGAGVVPLLVEIEHRLERDRELVHVDLPLGEGAVLAWLRRSGKVIEEAYSETAVSVTALVSAKIAGQLRKRLLAHGV